MAEVLSPEQLAALQDQLPTSDPTLPEKPTELLKASGGVPESITLPNGTVIEIRRPIDLIDMILAESVGTSKSELLYLQLYSMLWVCSVNGKPIKMPSNRAEFHALHVLIRDSGLEALIEAVGKMLPAEDNTATVKNS